MHDHFRVLALLTISALVVASNFAIADESDKDLLALARAHFNYDSITSEQEQRVFDTFFKNVQQGNETNLAPAEGKPTDLTPADQSSSDARHGDQWGVDRTIKAKWIVWLCKDPIASKMIPPGGIEISGAKIDGKVDLSWMKIQFQIRASGCYFKDSVILKWASVRGLKLEHAYIRGSDEKSLDGDGLTVEGDINLFDFDAEQPVSLRSVTVDGEFASQSAHFYTGALPYNGEINPALDLTSAKIGSGGRLI
jgi:hypothetical protein